MKVNEDTANSKDDQITIVPPEEVQNNDRNKSFNNNKLLDAEFIIENEVFAETYREYEMAVVNSHSEVYEKESEIIPIEVAIFGIAPSANVRTRLSCFNVKTNCFILR